MQPNVLSQMEKKAQFEAELQRYEEQADFLFRKQRLERIEYFSDQYDFLANEYPCNVFYQVIMQYLSKGLMYHSIYAAFQAARSNDEEVRQRLASTHSVMEVFQTAQHIEDPKDWSKNRLRVMEILLRDKFRRNADLRERLNATGHYQLINTTHQATTSNLFWGIVEGKGQNWLGRLLEEVRADIQSMDDVEKWLLMTYPVEKDKMLIPVIKLAVQKEGELIENIKLIEKPFYLFGQHKKCDVQLAHPLISRKHCALFINDKQEIQLVDLGSRGGTYLNEQPIEPHITYTLQNEDTLRFARSTRLYTVDVDYQDCREYVVRKIRQLEHKVHLLDKVHQGKASQEELKASLGLQVQDTVMVQNLPEKVSHFELKQLFSKRGKIIELKIPLDRITGNTKNVAFIKYELEKDAHWVVDNEKPVYKGQKLRLSLASNDSIDRFYEELRWGESGAAATRPDIKVEEPERKQSSKSKSRSRSRSHKKHKKHHKKHKKK